MSDYKYDLKSVETDEQKRVRFLRFNIIQRGERYSAPNKYRFVHPDKEDKPYISNVEQDLELRCDKYGNWSAFMAMHGMNGDRDPRYAMARLANWLKGLGEAVEALKDDIDVGLENPLQIDDQFRYTVDVLIERLKQETCPLSNVVEYEED